MKYYNNWRDALVDFIKQYGHNYDDSYNLVAEFEEQLGRNIKGAYFLVNIGESK